MARSAENVAFARPTSPTEEEILAACHIARVDEFAESFENRYDTVVRRTRRETFRRPEAARLDRARHSG